MVLGQFLELQFVLGVDGVEYRHSDHDDDHAAHPEDSPQFAVSLSPFRHGLGHQRLETVAPGGFRHTLNTSFLAALQTPLH